MKQHRTLLALAVLTLTAIFCGGTAPAQGDTEAAATLQALTAQAVVMPTAVTKAVTPSPEPPSTGGISGQVTLNVKSPFIRVVAFQVGSDQYFSINLQTGQTAYEINDLPPGAYRVLAYTAPTQSSVPATGAYTQYVICGMSSACTDHTLINVEVFAGQVRPNVNLLDTFQMPEYPMDPLAIMSGTDNIPTNTPPGGKSGSIAGRLTYPAAGVPAMAVIAYKIDSPNEYYYVLTVHQQDTFQIDNLPVGDYYVVTYTLGGNGFPAGLAGGYTAAVQCGLIPTCTDHSLLPVQVKAGMVNDNIIPGDFDAPAGTFPAYPLP
jgi:hypothetical protein